MKRVLCLGFVFLFLAPFFVFAQSSPVVFSTPGTYTWTVPDNVLKIKVEVWGAGGGGGGGAGPYAGPANLASSAGTGGGGGGGGGYVTKEITVVPKTKYTVVVGAGGTGGLTGPYKRDVFSDHPTCVQVQHLLGVSGKNAGASSFSVDKSPVAIASATGGAGGEGGLPDKCITGSAIRMGGIGGIAGGEKGGATFEQGTTAVYFGGAGGKGATGGAGGEGGNADNYFCPAAQRPCTVPAEYPGFAPGGGGAGGSFFPVLLYRGTPKGGDGASGRVSIKILEIVPVNNDLPVTAVTSLFCGGKIELSWTKATPANSKNAAGYIIYRLDKDPLVDPTSYVTIKIRDVNTVKSTDTTPSVNAKYWYYVFPATAAELAVESGGTVNAAGVILAQQSVSRGFSGSQVFQTLGSGASAAGSFAISSQACPPTTKFTLKALTHPQCGGKIDLSWTKADTSNSSRDAAGYLIYRFDKDPSLNPSAIHTIVAKIRDLNTISYTDTTPSVNAKYWYYARPAAAAEVANSSSLPRTSTASVLLAQSGGVIKFDTGLGGSQGPGDILEFVSAVSSVSCGPTNLKVVPECYNDQGIKGKGPFHESNFLSWGAVSNANGYYVYRRDVTTSKTTSFEKISLRQCRGLLSFAGCADGLYTQSDGYISKNYEYRVTGVVEGKETESSNVVFQEGFADACPGAEKPFVTVPKDCASFTRPGAYLWTVPAGISKVKIKLWGAGGCWDAGHVNPPVGGGNGGGGGGYSEHVLDVTSGTNYSGVVGESRCNFASAGETTLLGPVAGSFYRAGGGISGGAGGFGVVTYGGDGGRVNSGNGGGGGGGAGGPAGGNNLNNEGGRGGMSIRGGSGGDGGRYVDPPLTCGSSTSGKNGTYPGGGGGGGSWCNDIPGSHTTPYSGGLGANGQVMIECESLSPVPVNPDLTPAPSTPTVSDGEAGASYVNPDDKLTYFIPGKKAKIDGSILNLGPGVVPAGKHFNVRFQKSSTQTFDTTNVGVVDVVAPVGNLLKNGTIAMSYAYPSLAADDGKTYYFRYCVDQPPTDGVGSVAEQQGPNDATVIPAVGEFNNCSGVTTVKFKSKTNVPPPAPVLSCGAGEETLKSFTTPGTDTWTVLPSVSKIRVKVWGAGGTGGSGGLYTGGIHVATAGAGGGGGGYAESELSVKEGELYNIRVGRGGVTDFWFNSEDYADFFDPPDVPKGGFQGGSQGLFSLSFVELTRAGNSEFSKDGTALVGAGGGGGGGTYINVGSPYNSNGAKGRGKGRIVGGQGGGVGGVGAFGVPSNGGGGGSGYAGQKQLTGGIAQKADLHDSSSGAAGANGGVGGLAGRCGRNGHGTDCATTVLPGVRGPSAQNGLAPGGGGGGSSTGLEFGANQDYAGKGADGAVLICGIKTVEPSKPDLIISSGPSVGGALVAGQTLTFSATVKNQGTATPITFYNRFQILNSAGTSVVAAIGSPTVAGLGADKTQDVTATWKAVVGNYRIHVCADTDGAIVAGNLKTGTVGNPNHHNLVDESDENNNCSPEGINAPPFTIVAPNPDLTSNNATPPDHNTPAVTGTTWIDTSVTPNVTYFVPGTSITLAAKPKNLGPGVVSASQLFKVKFQRTTTGQNNTTDLLKADAASRTGDDKINTGSVSGPLAANAIVTSAVTITDTSSGAAASTVAGTVTSYDFRYCVDMPPNDYLGNVAELQGASSAVDQAANPSVGEYNNCSGATTIKLKPKPTVTPAPTVTLQIRKSGTNEYKNSSVDVDYAEQVDLKWTATNATSCTASGDWSGTKNKDGGEQTGVGGVLSKALYRYTIECEGLGGKSAPASVTAKAALSLACSSSVSEKTISWTALPTPATLPSGSQLSYGYNWSSVDASPASAVTKDYVATYKVAGEKTASLTLTATDGRVTPNTVRTVPITCRATVFEPPPAKNPDLIISIKPSVSRATGATDPLYVGEKLTFIATVKNQGESPASNIFYNRFQILREDKAVEATVGEPTLPSLAVGSTEVVISSSWTAVAGTYRVVACADTSNTLAKHNKIDEGDKEGNNCSPSDSGAGGTTIKVEKPDITPLGAAGAVPGPNAPVPSGTTFVKDTVTYYRSGTKVTFTVEPKNIGGTFTTPPPSFNVKLQVKDAVHPDTPAGDAFYVDRGTAAISGGLLYNQSKTATLEDISGATETKAFKYRYCADFPPNENQTGDPTGLGLVAESNEGNNCSGPVVINYGLPNVPPATLTLKVRKAGVEPYTHDLLTVDDGDRVDLTWNYTGTSACTASWKSPSAISGVDSDFSVGPLTRAGSPYTYTVTCGSLSDKVTVNVKPPEPTRGLSCVLDVRSAGKEFGKNIIIFSGGEVELQWKVTGVASSISLFKFTLNAKEGNNLVTGNTLNGVAKSGNLSTGRYQYRLNATNDATGDTRGCVVDVQVDSAPLPDLIPVGLPAVNGETNPADGSFTSGRPITIGAKAKNIGGSGAGAFNIKFQYKEQGGEYVEFPNHAEVSKGLPAGRELSPSAVITYTSGVTENRTLILRYCVDMPPPNDDTILLSGGAGGFGSVLERQGISHTADKARGVGEFNNCSGELPITFKPSEGSKDPFGTLNCATVGTSQIRLKWTQQNGVNVSLFRGTGAGSFMQTVSGSSGTVTDLGRTPGATYNYYLRNGTTATSEQLASAVCTLPTTAPLSVSCSVSPDPLDLANSSSAIWTADTHSTGASPFSYYWEVDSLPHQTTAVPSVSVDYSNTPRAFKKGKVTVTDSSTITVSDPKTATADCGKPKTVSPPQSTPFSILCSVSATSTDALGNESMTLTAIIDNAGTPEYLYKWEVDGKPYPPSDPTKPFIVRVPYDHAKASAPGWKSGTVTVTDSFTRTDWDRKTAPANCGVSVYNSSDDFVLITGPVLTLNFIGETAVSNRIPVTIKADWFDKDIRISASPDTIAGAPVSYIFYKRGSSTPIAPPVTASTPAILTKADYALGLEMAVRASKFIPAGSYPNSKTPDAITIHSGGGGKKHSNTVRLDVNDSRPQFQNF